ncbi:MAG: AtpZ/AtpI family protein [Deltaproteobacteria bacterium]|nr:AtpZ/AtpI family protein [Deltaproteobacteria bacterium]
MSKRQVARKSKTKKVFDQVSRYASVGLELGFSVAIGIVSGYYLDQWLGTSPWLTIFLLLCGVAAGFKRIYLVLKSLEREQEIEEDEADR